MRVVCRVELAGRLERPSETGLCRGPAADVSKIAVMQRDSVATRDSRPGQQA